MAQSIDSSAFAVLRAYLDARATFSDADFDTVRQAFIHRRLAAGEFLQRAGEVSRYAAFVASRLPAQLRDRRQGQGAHRPVRARNVVDGRFDQPDEGHAVGVLHRSDRGLRAAADRPCRRSSSLIEHVPAVSPPPSGPAFSVTPLPRISASSARSARPPRSATSNFSRTYPSIVQRVPQTMLASYLGMTPRRSAGSARTSRGDNRSPRERRRTWRRRSTGAT